MALLPNWDCFKQLWKITQHSSQGQTQSLFFFFKWCICNSFNYEHHSSALRCMCKASKSISANHASIYDKSGWIVSINTMRMHTIAFVGKTDNSIVITTWTLCKKLRTSQAKWEHGVIVDVNQIQNGNWWPYVLYIFFLSYTLFLFESRHEKLSQEIDLHLNLVKVQDQPAS